MQLREYHNHIWPVFGDELWRHHLQEVVPPEFIAEYRPDVVVILSQLHSKEIAGTVSEILDYEPTVYTL